MAVSRFEKGSVVRINGYFKTPKTATPPNVYIDPTVLTLTIRMPDHTVETRTYGDGDDITRIETGKYTATINLAQEGTYKWRWHAENGSEQIGVKTGSFDSVSESDF